MCFPTILDLPLRRSGLVKYISEAFSLVELRAIAHHLGDIVDAGGRASKSGESSSDSGVGSGAHAAGKNGGRGGGGGGGGRGGWADADDDSSDDPDDDEDEGVEYSWSAQGGSGRHQAPTLVNRMPQAICTNYLRVSGLDLFCVVGEGS